MLTPNFILTARHIHANVKSERDYRAQQARYLAKFCESYPNMPQPKARIVTPHPPAFVSGGRWLVECACGNCPAIEPTYNGLALCYECGAIYEGVELPADAAAIEQALVARPNMADRYWNPHMALHDVQVNTAVLTGAAQ